MTACETARERMGAYVDGELELSAVLDFERHLAGCPDCTRALAAQQAMREAIGGARLRFEPSREQTGRLLDALRGGESGARAAAPSRSTDARRRPRTGGPFRWDLLAAAFAVAVLSFTLGRFGPGSAPAPAPSLEGEVVASHVRSLLAGHPTDVVSSDRHTVKPWFAGRLDYSPVVLDLAGSGFPLVGGRLDYLGERPVAALVYRSGRHLYNLFTWPVAGSPVSAAHFSADSLRGFHLIHWTRSGMQYWLVSDAADTELRRFANLLDAAMAGEAGR